MVCAIFSAHNMFFDTTHGWSFLRSQQWSFDTEIGRRIPDEETFQGFFTLDGGGRTDNSPRRVMTSIGGSSK